MRKSNLHGEEKLIQAELTDAKHRRLVRPSSMRSSAKLEGHLDCLPGGATNRPRNSQIGAITDHRVANHERQQCIIALAVNRPQATSGIGRIRLTQRDLTAVAYGPQIRRHENRTPTLTKNRDSQVPGD